MNERIVADGNMVFAAEVRLASMALCSLQAGCVALRWRRPSSFLSLTRLNHLSAAAPPSPRRPPCWSECGIPIRRSRSSGSRLRAALLTVSELQPHDRRECRRRDPHIEGRRGPSTSWNRLTMRRGARPQRVAGDPGDRQRGQAGTLRTPHPSSQTERGEDQTGRPAEATRADPR